jgi:hypothetical protein
MRYLILLAALAFAGCGDSSDDASSTEAVEEASDVLGESLHESLDAAEAVEDELMKSKADMDAALKEAEGR